MMLDRLYRHPGPWTLVVLSLAACGGGGLAGGGEPAPEPVSCLALPAEITWHRDDLSSEWTDMLVDKKGRLWVAGWTHGIVGQSTIEPSGNSRPVLRLSNAEGVLLADLGAQIDTPGTDTLEALAITATSTVYAAGRTSGSLDGRPNAGQFDSFIAWSDDYSDARPWSLLQAGTSAPQHPRRLAVDEQGAVVLAGEDDTFIPSNYVEAWSDAFVSRWQRQLAGTASDRLVPAWTWQFGSESSDWPVDMQLDSEGNVLLFGETTGSVAPGATPAGLTDRFLMRVSPDGQVLASRQWGTGGDERAARLAVDR